MGTLGATDVLGVAYLPEPLSGVNGPQGFQADGSSFEDRLAEEAGFTIRFPNSFGSDGRPHIDRFLIRAGNPDGAKYRPGDEWIEIYQGEELRYVGTPTSSEADDEALTITGFNGFWLLKKARERDSGYWPGVAPRDFFEFYSQVWQDVGSDRFDPPASGVRFAGSGTPQTTDDGKWTYKWCGQDTDGSAWLVPPPGPAAHAGTDWATLDGTETMPMGRQSPDRYGAIRAEIEWSRSTFSGADSDNVPHFRFGLYDFVASGGVEFIEFVDADLRDRLYVAVSDDSGANYTTIDARINIEKSPVRMVLEARDAWVFCWHDGQLVAVVPAPDMDLNVVPGAHVIPGTQANCWMKVHQMVVRRTVPFLMRGDEGGDLHLPGLPPSGGLAAAFYNEIGLRAAVTGPAAAAALPNYLLRPNLEPSRRDRHKALDFWGIDGDDDHPAWWPPAPATADVSARWQGSVYLDLADNDYRLNHRYGDRLRVWIGFTRSGSEVVNDWGSPGTSEAGGTSNLTLLNALGLPNGWYPIVIEWARNPTESDPGSPSVLRLRVGTVAKPDLYWNLGGSTFRREQGVDNPVGHWPVDGVTHSLALNSLVTGGQFPDMSGNGNHATTWLTGPRGDSMSPGHKAASFFAPYFIQIPHSTEFDVGGSITLEALALPQLVNGKRVIAWKSNSFGFYIEDGVLKADLPFAAGAHTFVGPALDTGVWSHVAFTWNSTSGTYIFYVNGQLAAAGTFAGTRTLGTSNLFFGKHGASAEWYWEGLMADVAIYGSSLSAARIFAHFTALSQVAVGELSPLGCFEGLVRNQSHYEQLRALNEQFGVQFGVEPRSLESGEFPGQIIPLVRRGRGTDKQLTESEGENFGSTVNAEDTIDSLTIDGAGLGEGASQLTLETLLFDELGKHFMIHADYDSLSDITILENLALRVASLLAIHADVWEEVRANPPGIRELRQTFRLPTEIAEFGWEAGDGILIDNENVGVVDQEPRQLLSVTWPVGPGGLGAPTVEFRQRPRNFREWLRKVQRYGLDPQRNYQGQKVAVNSATVVAPADAHISLPARLDTVLAFTLKVDIKGSATAQVVSLNGTPLPFSVDAVGAYDLLPYLEASSGIGLAYVSVANVGAEICLYSLELIKLV